MNIYIKIFYNWMRKNITDQSFIKRLLKDIKKSKLTSIIFK